MGIWSVALAFVALTQPAAAQSGESDLLYFKGFADAPKSEFFSVAQPQIYCPNGYLPVGGGAEIPGPERNSAIAGLHPEPGNSWGADVWSYGVNKKVKTTAWGVCAENLGNISTASSTVNTSGIGASAGVPECPGAMQPAGGGYEAANVTDWYMRTTGYSSTGWATEVWRRVDGAGSYTTYANCMSGGSPKLSRKFVKAKRHVTVTAWCKGDRHVTGGGPLGEDKSWAVVSKPVDSKADANKIPDDGWRAKVIIPGRKKHNVGVDASCR